MQVQVSEENHIVYHETEEWTQFILRWQHELLSLVINYGGDLCLNLPWLLINEVGPGELFLDSVIKRTVPNLIRVCVEDVNCEPARCIKFNDLKWTSIG